MLNLLTDAWLPVRRRKTGRCTIRPAQITQDYDDNPVVSIDWPRPDFRIATLELLVGLLTTIVPPQERRDWHRWWNGPPSPDELDEAFAPFVHAFNLDGDGPLFLQDLEDLQADAEPVERLLIEAPGDATTIKNTDLMVHRGRFDRLGRAAAAITLYTFQSWAPAGGAGNRTGLRGGGPLVTLVAPGLAPTLWQMVWANVPLADGPPEADELPLVFPWLAPTVVSEGSSVVTPGSSSRLQCWWGMPRRIRLDFTSLPAPAACDLTGDRDIVGVTSWRQRPRGANYAAWGRVHPLTPHYKQKDEFLPLHPQPGGIGYRHWVGLVLNAKDDTRLPAATVSTWHGRGLDVGVHRARLIAAGYDMDNMKARGFVESDMPLPTALTVEAQSHLDDLARALVEAADQVAGLLRSAVRNALFSPGATIKPDAAVLNAVRERLWEDTESRFFGYLNTAADQPTMDLDAARREWLGHLREIALSLFDEAAPLTPDAGGTQAVRISRARRFLGLALNGYTPAGQQLFMSLSMARPEVKAAGANKDSRRKRKAA